MDATRNKIDELISANYDDFDQMYAAIRRLASASGADREQLRAYVDSQASASADQTLKLAIAALMVGNLDRAIEFLRAAPEGREKRWLLGLTFKAQGDYAHALADLERAMARDFDKVRVLSEMVEAQRLAGDMKSAKQTLKQLQQADPNSGQYFYQAAGIAEAEGKTTEAIELLEQAVEKAPAFIPALFRLAFLVDLNGDEGRAKELYKQCVQHEPAHVNALLNLSVLCDDSGEYEQAIAYLKRILHVHPNHGRARLFLKDAMSSSDMYYDEEYEKRRDKFQQVLEMPISDFELSVRSRNCLKKMGIRTLGDLTRITEAELLSYKNFGETSLNEIKAIMSSKNLRLGQALEDQASRKAASILPGVGAEDDQPRPDQSLMAKSIDELNLSVRSRKCLQRLDVQTIGDLTNYTEAQLMAVKNFGTISLKEIKDRLAEMNLSLRVPEV
jgi:DNA-directed RNA polymerase subunit alpha